MNKKVIIIGAAAVAVLAVAGIKYFPSSSEVATSLGSPGVIAENFKTGSLTEDISQEDCTLTNGDETQCYRITITGTPVDTTIGPFCPTTTSTTAEDAGIWLDGSKIYDVDGQFIMDLSTIYGDVKWKLYDDTGKVNVTDTKEAFNGAAKPDVEDQYMYHCVEGKYEWTETGKAVPISILVPVNPVTTSTPVTSTGADLGVTINGLVMAASAPVDAILGAYTIAAFDDCGGHFNPFEGYHMHAFTNCEGATYGSKIEDPNAETNLIGYAMDGVAVFAPLDHESTIELDECNGRTTEKDGYHYYAQSPETNKIVKCFMGLTAVDTSADAQMPAGGPPAGGPPSGQSSLPFPPQVMTALMYAGGGIVGVAVIAGVLVFRSRKRKKLAA